MKPTDRPAEYAAALGGIVFLVGHGLGWSSEVTTAVGAVVAALPALVTSIVASRQKPSRPSLVTASEASAAAVPR